MPSHYQAAIRYNIIDLCLRNKGRIWHWQQLQEAIASHLNEYQGIEKAPSRRTIMSDIAAMRSGVLGYHAPIEYSRTDGYRYFDSTFSIHKAYVPISLLQDFEEALSVVRQSLGQTEQSRLVASLTRIAEHLKVQQNETYKPIIYLEHSLNDPGYKWLDTIYQYIKDKKAIRVEYAPFNGEKVVHILSPWFIKEYNNRWYVFGYHHKADKIYNLALDRIAAVHSTLQTYTEQDGDYTDRYFDHLYGVTIPDGSTPVVFRFETTPLLSRYMDSKPIHKAQIKESESNDKAIYSLRVYDNYEIRSKLRSFGEDLVIISPKS